MKKANLAWTYVNTRKKMEEIRASIEKTREEIAELDEEDDGYQKEFYGRYMQARRDAGIPEDENPDNFIAYMCDDLDLGF